MTIFISTYKDDKKFFINLARNKLAQSSYHRINEVYKGATLDSLENSRAVRAHIAGKFFYILKLKHLLTRVRPHEFTSRLLQNSFFKYDNFV